MMAGDLTQHLGRVIIGIISIALLVMGLFSFEGALIRFRQKIWIEGAFWASMGFLAFAVTGAVLFAVVRFASIA